MRTLVFAALTVLALALPASGQSQRSQVPPEALLGFRVEAVRKTFPVAPVVVIADSPWAYVSAIGEWSPERRFPVLIDDGTDAAREHIARFVRAFGPERVRLLSRDEKPEDLERAVTRVAASAWGADGDDDAALRKLWETLGHAPPGLIVASKNDPAWPAAAALAAGRGQPIVWMERVGGRLGGTIERGDLQRLEDAIEAAARNGPWSWRALGDEIDAVTLCLNAPAKVESAEKGPLALTDVLGRAGNDRWAWAGQIIGSEAESAYRAMSSLFLQPESAWLFNGYTGGGAFAAYAVDGAGTRLQDAGVTLLRSGRPAGSRRDWSLEAMSGVEAQLVFVNSSGQRRWFKLAGGRADAVDTPMLLAPAAVHFIHSFSTQNLDDENSIARAWLDQGAFLYVGSVDEPYLQAFVRPMDLATRLLVPAPFGPAVRSDGPPWKVTVLGDPLYTLGPAAPSAPATVDFGGLRSVETELAAALGNRDFDRAGRLLAMLGRDEDLAKLARAALRDDPAVVSPGFASAALLAAVRLGQVELLPSLFDSMNMDRRTDPRHVHPVWHLAEPLLSGAPDPELARFLGRIVRPARFERDAQLAARALSRAVGSDAAARLLTRLMEEAPSDAARRELADELTRY